MNSSGRGRICPCQRSFECALEYQGRGVLRKTAHGSGLKPVPFDLPGFTVDPAFETAPVSRDRELESIVGGFEFDPVAGGFGGPEPGPASQSDFARDFGTEAALCLPETDQLGGGALLDFIRRERFEPGPRQDEQIERVRIGRFISGLLEQFGSNYSQPVEKLFRNPEDFLPIAVRKVATAILRPPVPCRTPLLWNQTDSYWATGPSSPRPDGYRPTVDR